MEKNKKIAKNSLFLTVRVLFNLFITLYTSRIILKELGVTDFGLFNVVGGLVGIIGFFQSVLSNVNVRFFSNLIGAKQDYLLRKYVEFCNIFYLLIILIVVFFAETVGVWFINKVLVIPEDRLFACNIVFQSSILIFALSTINVIYNSLIIAREDMHIYSYVGIIQSFGKLAIALGLGLFLYDHLIIYSLLNVLLFVLVLSFSIYYVIKNYSEVSFKMKWNNEIFREFAPFASWNLVGCGVWAMNTQGINILLNNAFDPTVNAARAIATQISNSTKIFAVNTITSFRPQIISSYSEKNYDRYNELIYTSSRFSFYLLWVLALPLMLSLPFVLDLWLIDVPEYAAIFCIYTICFTLVDMLNEPIWSAVQATGFIKKYQLYGNVVFALALPVSYVLVDWLKMSPVSPFIALFVIRLIYFFVLLPVVRRQAKISLTVYFTRVIVNIVVVVVTSLVLSFIGSQLLSYLKIEPMLLNLLQVAIIFVSCLVVIVTLGLTKTERKTVLQYIKKKI